MYSYIPYMYSEVAYMFLEIMNLVHNILHYQFPPRPDDLNQLQQWD